MVEKPWEGRSVRGYDAWARVSQQSTGEWITFSVRSSEVSLTPEAAKVLARQINALANDMIRRRTA